MANAVPTGFSFNPFLKRDLFHRFSKPSYQSTLTDNTKVEIKAAATYPAIVHIGDQIYIREADFYLDINDSGRNGIDAGGVAASTLYYLYAIAPNSTSEIQNTAFDVVASKSDPATGPYGFSDWSYLGAFFVNSSSQLDKFISSGGHYGTTASLGSVTHNTTSDTAKTITIPTYAEFAMIRSEMTTIGAAGRNGQVRSISGGAAIAKAVAVTTTESEQSVTWIPIIESKTIYLDVSNADSTLTVIPFGWYENVHRFK